MPHLSPETKFMGQVTAQAMHEMQNVLAIIHESAGLMGDIMAVNTKAKLKHRDKLENTLSHVVSQIQRGKHILGSISRLAHAPDPDQQTSCDLAEHLRVTVLLAERMLRLKHASITAQIIEEPLQVKIPAMDVLMVLYTALSWAAEGDCAHKEITLSFTRQEYSACIHITPPEDGIPQSPVPNSLAELLSNENVLWGTHQLRLLFPTA